MSWTKRVHHPSEMVKKGDKVKVIVLNMDIENKRISLGMKQLTDSPWEGLRDKFPVGTEVDCPITRLLEKGVVVDLGDDVEGFVPVSQLGIRGTATNPADVYRNGDRLELKVIEVDPESHRIVLSVRDLNAAKKFIKERIKEIAELEAAEKEPAEKKVAGSGTVEEAKDKASEEKTQEKSAAEGKKSEAAGKAEKGAAGAEEEKQKAGEESQDKAETEETAVEKEDPEEEKPEDKKQAEEDAKKELEKSEPGKGKRVKQKEAPEDEGSEEKIEGEEAKKSEER